MTRIKSTDRITPKGTPARIKQYDDIAKRDTRRVELAINLAMAKTRKS